MVRHVVIVVRYVVVKEWSANEYNIAEMAVMPEESRIVESANGNLPAHSHAAESTAFTERRGRRRRDNCRPYHRRGNPTEKFCHHFGPPPKRASQARCARRRQMRDSANSGFDKLGMRWMTRSRNPAETGAARLREGSKPAAKLSPRPSSSDNGPYTTVEPHVCPIKRVECVNYHQTRRVYFSLRA